MSKDAEVMGAEEESEGGSDEVAAPSHTGKVLILIYCTANGYYTDNIHAGTGTGLSTVSSSCARVCEDRDHDS